MTAEKPGRVPEWFQQGRIRWAWGAWEPPSFYLRSGSLSGGVDGRARWGSKWWDYVHSEEHVRAMADIGINLVTTHYYKGLGLRFEAEEQERTKALVELYHKYGIHVLGYCQYTTVYPETMKDEIPDLEDHVQYGPDGSKRLYGGSCYFRWQGDLTSRTFMDYLKTVIDHALTDIGLDGVEWDGTAYNCYCERCRAAFREFLKERYAGREYELFGLPHFDHAEPPPQIASADPMYQAWHEFRTKVMHDTLRELYAYAKSVKEDAIFATYPHAPQLNRRDRDRIMPWVGDYLDLATSETHEMPRIEQDGSLVCAVRHLKQCTALGVPTFVTAWMKYTSERGYRAPNCAEEVKLSIAESACYGGHPFPATWANRPLGRDGKCLYQAPERGQALKSYMNFFAEHEELYAGAAPLANVGVYYSLRSLDYDRDAAGGNIQGLEQILLQHQIPFGVILGLSGGDSFPYELVCVANQRMLSDEEAEAFKRHLDSGGALLITAQTGRYDERRRERFDDALADLYDHPGVLYLPEGEERAPDGPEGRVSPLYPYLPENHQEIATAVVSMTPRGLPATVQASGYVGTDVYRLADGRTAVHLLNYNNKAGATRAVVRLAPWLDADTHKLELATPDEDTSAQARPDGTIVVMGLDTYAVVIVG